MSENMKETVADFQTCTGIEAGAEATLHFDETKRDLSRAVSKVVPPDTQSLQPRLDPDTVVAEDGGNTPGVSLKRATDMMEVGDVGYPQSKKISIEESNHTQECFPATSDKSDHERMLKFNITYCDRVLRVELPESGTISDLKIKLQRKVKIAPCRQLLSNWVRLDQYENLPFTKLSLPNENFLYLTKKQNEEGFTAKEKNSVFDRFSGTYTLNVKFEGKTYNLKYQGTKTILEVKGDIYTLINVHVRNQIWSGWPLNIDENTMLAHSGINYPEHDLTVRQSLQVNHKERKNFTVDHDYLVDDNITEKRTESLIPENVEDELVGTKMFGENFTARYGPTHPAFYRGTLEDAIKEACAKPAKDRKILAIYLHHSVTVLNNVFCTQLLAFDIVMQTYEKSFILWGWDITFESNRTKLQQSVNQCLGSTAAMILRSIPVGCLPAFVFIMKFRSSTEIFNVVNGNVGVNELLSSFIQYVEVFTKHQRVEIEEEQENASRKLLEQVHSQSLAADRAKKEVKKVQEQAGSKARTRLESEKAESEAKEEVDWKMVKVSLPAEPSLDHDDITFIKVRMPKGKYIERRFQSNTKLKVLIDFLEVRGFSMDEYKAILSLTGRDLTSLDVNQTLRELKLGPQETVILEAR